MSIVVTVAGTGVEHHGSYRTLAGATTCTSAGPPVTPSAPSCDCPEEIKLTVYMMGYIASKISAIMTVVSTSADPPVTPSAPSCDCLEEIK